MAVTVRFCLNLAYLFMLGPGVAVIVLGVLSDGVLRLGLIVGGGPGRDPTAADEAAPRLRRDCRRTARLRGRGGIQTPVLLIVPTDPAAAIRRGHWWLRRDATADLQRLGAPVVINPRPLDHTLAEIQAAVHSYAR